ncbi:membrane protein, PF09851 family [Leptospira interrogans str. 2002000626]|uniref:Membrane protein, PF09851 family n=1 Tax=Leptospira interrogans str. 2002000626 TaxID=996803 RepID=A0A829DC51_LEPIR|nr:membrane protein, PF09851 family [Leptospira interrogans str. 2002000626]
MEVFIPDSAIGMLSYYKDLTGESKKFHIVYKTLVSISEQDKIKEVGASSKEIEKRLIELKKLFDKKLISEEEFRKKREEILRSL